MTDHQRPRQRRHGLRAQLPPDLLDCVGHLANSVTKGFSRELEPYGLTAMEFGLLRVCGARGECTAKDLATALPVDTSRVSRMVSNLFDMGLVARRRSPSDRRMVMLTLTDKGNELVSMLNERMEMFDSSLTKNITKEDVDTFKSVILRIRANHTSLA